MKVGKYKFRMLFLTILFFVLFGMANNSRALPAFPGAEGLGRDTVGGRGGQVIKVTNLNDSGVGSFRAACEASGPRVVVFEVSGNIDLLSQLNLVNPYITIAGQTSPGGVSVSGHSFYIATHDAIIRHMRFRHGGHHYDPNNNDDGHPLSIYGPEWNGGNLVYNIILDHCSFTWGVDETLSVTGGATSTTIQKCLVAKGLLSAGHEESNHSMGLMISGKYNYDTEVSLFRNYISTVYDRPPLIWNPFGHYQGDTVEADNIMLVDAQNNVSYNWWHGSRPIVGGWRNSVNWVNNWSKEGPNSNRYDAFLAIDTAGSNSPTTPYPMTYLSGNYGVNKTTGALFGGGTDWLVSNYYLGTIANPGFQSSSLFAVDVPLSSSTMTSTLATEIVNDSGATVPLRDSVDTEIVGDYANNTGTIPASVVYPDDWPVYATSNPPADTDNDGMADAWETTAFGNLSQTSTNDFDIDGYTNIEEYINYIADGGSSDTIAPAAPSGLSVN